MLDEINDILSFCPLVLYEKVLFVSFVAILKINVCVSNALLPSRLGLLLRAVSYNAGLLLGPDL